MPKLLINPSKNLGYTDLYLDFVNGRTKGKPLFPTDTLESVADILEASNYDREALIEILTTQNENYQSGPKTLENIKRLKDSRAVCIISGQQAVLFGGPMYTLIKAVAIIKAAEKYEQQLGRPVIPIFWIAGDDHDFEEANHTQLLNRSGEMCDISYTTPPATELPLGWIKFTDEQMLDQAKEALKDCCGESEFTSDLYDLINRSYTSEDSFVTAFGKLFAGLLADRGLVLFCPTDDRVKRLAIPFFKQVLLKQEIIHQTIADTNSVLTDSGFHIQVEKKQTATYLFYEQEGRKPILQKGLHFTVGENHYTRVELDALIDQHPEKFSPDVMTRPLMQSYLFPALAQKGGPSEIAYLTQINKLFAIFDLQAPVLQARPTATVIETRYEKLMDDFGISFEELFTDIEQVINRILAASFPADLEHKFTELSENVEKQFQNFVNDSLEFDESLKKTANQTYGKIDYTLKNFQQKLFAAHKRKSSETRNRIYRLQNSISPNRNFQERTINSSYFVARYGPEFVQFLCDNLEPDETSHQLLYLGEMNK